MAKTVPIKEKLEPSSGTVFSPSHGDEKIQVATPSDADREVTEEAEEPEQTEVKTEQGTEQTEEKTEPVTEEKTEIKKEPVATPSDATQKSEHDAE